MLTLSPRLVLLSRPATNRSFHRCASVVRFLQKLGTRNIAIIVVARSVRLVLRCARQTLIFYSNTLVTSHDPTNILYSPTLVQRTTLGRADLCALTGHYNVTPTRRFIRHFVTRSQRIQRRNHWGYFRLSPTKRHRSRTRQRRRTNILSTIRLYRRSRLRRLNSTNTTNNRPNHIRTRPSRIPQNTIRTNIRTDIPTTRRPIRLPIQPQPKRSTMQRPRNTLPPILTM